MVAVLLTVPEAPAIVTVYVPTVAVPAADRVKRLLVVAGFVPKLALTPLGKPDAVKVTLPLNPLRGWIVMVVVVELAAPWRKVKLEGDAERLKPGRDDDGQLLTRLAALSVPMPVAKSQPTLVPYPGKKAVLQLEHTPTDLSPTTQLTPTHL